MKAVLALLLMTVPALAQQPSSYTITITPAQLDLIGKALGKLPFEESYQTIEVIRGQVAKAQADAAKPPPAPPEPKEQPK